MKTTQYPPMFPGAPEPHEIIGVNLINDFNQHYKATYRCQSAEQFLIAVKSIPEAIRVKIGIAYTNLNALGWFPMGLDKMGRIIWQYVLDLRMPEIRELANRVFTKEESNLARATVHKRMNKVDNRMPKCETWDFNQDGDNGR